MFKSAILIFDLINILQKLYITEIDGTNCNLLSFSCAVILYEHWTKNAHHLGLWSNAIQAFSVPAARASPGITGHHQGACQKCRILGPTPGPGHPQEERVSSPGDSDACFKAVTGRTGEVCAENTPAMTLPRRSRGLEEGTEASAF